MSVLAARPDTDAALAGVVAGRTVVSAESAWRLLRDHDDTSVGPGRHQDAVDDLAAAAPDLAHTVVQQAQRIDDQAQRIEEQSKRIRTAFAVAEARRSVVAEYLHGEECETRYDGSCDCGHEELLTTFAELARVLGTIA